MVLLLDCHKQKQYVTSVPYTHLKVEHPEEEILILRLDFENYWKLKCEDPQALDMWMSTIQEASATSSLNAILDEQLNQKDQGFMLISATYGVLEKTKTSKDVTELLQYIIDNQGGQGLHLEAGDKANVLGNPAPGKSKKLQVVYSVNGTRMRTIYKSKDEVKIP